MGNVMKLWSNHEPNPFRLVPWGETWREVRRQGPRSRAAREGGGPSGTDRDREVPQPERRVPVWRDRGSAAARPGHGLAAPEGLEGGGIDPRHDRSPARVLLHRSRRFAASQVPDGGAWIMNGISEDQDVRGTVRERYEAIAEGRSAGCCGTD